MIRRSHINQARRVLLWTILFTVFGFTGLIAAMETWNPERFDAEYVHRMNLLRADLARHPGRPLCLVCGSSRLVLAFQPEMVSTLRSGENEEAILFNYSHFGASPWMTLVELDRLFRSGIRPRWIVLELVPAHLAESDDRIVANVVNARELPLLWNHGSPIRFTRRYLSQRLSLATSYPAYLLGATSTETEPLCEQGGYPGLKAEIDLTTREEKLKHTRQFLHQPVSQFQVRNETDQVFRHCLRLCQQHQAEVMVILMPEGSEMRSWYPPSARGELEEYLHRLEKDYGIRTVDASTWLSDELFYDQHHVLKQGADHFTRRFAEEVLHPLISANSPRKEK